MALFGELQEPICQGITWVTAGAVFQKIADPESRKD